MPVTYFASVGVTRKDDRHRHEKLRLLLRELAASQKKKPKRVVGWLVVFGLNDPLRQYFSLYRVVSQREGERGEKG